MTMLAWIVFGQIGGLIGWLLTGGRVPGGLTATVVLGIAGACTASLLAEAAGWGAVSGFDARSFVLATGGAIAALALLHLAGRPRYARP